MGKSLLGKFGIAVEAIAFQPTNFGKMLESIFQEMKDSGLVSAEQFAKAGFDKAIASVIEEYTNIKIPKIVFSDGEFDAQIELRIDYVKHIFNPTSVKDIAINGDTAQRLLDRLGGEKSVHYVDLKNNRVYGTYKECALSLLIGTELITTSSVSAGSCAALCLHEVGHAIGYCAYSDRFATTNQVLAAVSRSIKNDTLDKRKMVFTTAEKILNTKDKAFDGLENSQDVAATSVIILDAALRDQPQLDSGVYDESSFEALADNYAAKCGYGRQLIELVSLFEDIRFPTAKSYLAKRVSGRIIGTSLAIMTIEIIVTSASVITATMSGAAAIAAIAYAFTSIVFGGVGGHKHTYDTTKTRMVRVKEQMIAYLKDTSIAAADRRRMIEDLEKVDEVISKKTPTKEKLFDRISNYLMSNNRAIKEKMALQRDLEELAHNDLFVAAAKLRNF